MINMTAAAVASCCDGELILPQGIDVSESTSGAGPVPDAGDTLIRTIVLDSRKAGQGALFVPVIGEKTDAHRFIPQVFKAGCRVSLSMEDITAADGIIIKVDDTREALIKLACAIRQNISVPVIGVTGSVGKTTTREMIAAALRGGMRVYATSGNLNSQLGVPLTLAGFDEKAQIGVLEMGISMPGEMHRLADMVRPDAAVLTNIGITHLENLKTRDNILKEKMGICEFMKAGSPVILNKDNDLLSVCPVPEGLRAYYYGTGSDCDAYYKDPDSSDGRMNFTAHIRGRDIPVSLRVSGEHQILNALAALLTADIFGVELQAAVTGLNEYTGYSHRQQLIEKKGVTVIDDTYNASPVSMKAALSVLSVQPCSGRRIAVLADMKELGDNEATEHEELGRYIDGLGTVDMLIVLGKLAALIKEKAPGTPSEAFDDRASLDEYVRDFVKAGDTVLFKGSNSMQLSESVTSLLDSL